MHHGEFMSDLLSRWLAAPATALRAGLVLGLAASTLAACGGSSPSTNGRPVAQDGAFETAEDTPLEVHLPANGNGALTFSIVDAPAHGTLSEISANGVVTYTPSADYTGEDAVTFRASNRKGQSTQATVTITITPVNDTPTLSSVAHQTIAEDSSTGDLAFTVGDVETPADSLTVTASSSNTGLVPNDSQQSCPRRLWHQPHPQGGSRCQRQRLHHHHPLGERRRCHHLHHLHGRCHRPCEPLLGDTSRLAVED